MMESAAMDTLLDDAAALPESKWPARLAEWVDLLAADARRRGMKPEKAAEEAARVVLLLARHEGGRPFYLPRGDSLVQALRDRQIYLRHDGRNAEQLADEFRITVRHVQRICAEQRALQLRERQEDLFEP